MIQKQRYVLIAILLTSTICFAAYRANLSNPASALATSLIQPNMSTTDILVWANEAAVRLNTYNYLTYREDRQNMQNYFLPQTWNMYYKTLQKKHYKELLTEQKMTVSAVPLDVAVLLQQGVSEKRYTWKVEIPLLVRFKSGQRELTQKRSITLVIQRSPPYLGKRGVGIVSIYEQPVKKTSLT